MTTPEIDLTEDRLFHIHTGIVFAAVCAPSTWDAQKVEDEANFKMGSPGTSGGRWVISENLPEGVSENPIQCNDDTNRRHWILNC
jgi:hypothetical protein